MMDLAQAAAQQYVSDYEGRRADEEAAQDDADLRQRIKSYARAYSQP